MSLSILSDTSILLDTPTRGGRCQLGRTGKHVSRLVLVADKTEVSLNGCRLALPRHGKEVFAITQPDRHRRKLALSRDESSEHGAPMVNEPCDSSCCGNQEGLLRPPLPAVQVSEITLEKETSADWSYVG